MDIQLPVMSGLEATKEIRRLERLNRIGVFPPKSDANAEIGTGAEPDEMVAEAAKRAAGCNDFLTKPVSFVWLERKTVEWGCMQALIRFTT
jgi:osomolarity two-component system response regulator SSK1